MSCWRARNALSLSCPQDMTTLDLKAAFFHVIDDHRWLATGGCAWNLAGANAENATKKEADQLLPNINVMILDSLLLHARSLIDFYTKCQPAGSTDILLCDFSISIDQKLSEKLAKFKKPIEVHLLHLTDWRDREYRDLHAINNAQKDRPDWNHEAISIVNLVFDALKDVSEHGGNWQPAFKDLYDSSTARFREKLYAWPTYLCEKSDVEQYLKGLGL